MILQALYDYYQRKAADSESGIAPEGWEWKEIPFLVVIDREGNFLRFEDTREGEGKKKRAKRFLVPQGEKRTVGIKSFLLWDNIEYALGANPRHREDIQKRFSAFREKIENVVDVHLDIRSVRKFLDKKPMAQIERSADPLWPEMLEGNVFVTFKIEGSGLHTVCDALPKNVTADSDGEDMCLITGTKSRAARLHPSIKGVRGTNTSGASMVSFNLPAFCSYGKSQNANASTGEKASFAYTTALNFLLGKDSGNKVGVADTTIVFWAQKKDETFDLESEFAWVFTSDKDDPDKGVNAVKALFSAVESGRLPPDEGNRFYVLGLAPNAARISVRFWKTGTIREFAEKICRHFRDFEIIRPAQDRYEFLPLYQVLGATVLDYKMDKVPPNLAGAVVTSILDGAPYPRTLLHQCVRRIRAEQSKKDSRTGKSIQNVNRTRAAILKACINRFNRIYHPQNKEVLVALDRSNTDTGYRIGRLFAVLEKIQEESSPGINATIRDRFYGAASSTPVTVFPRLLKLKNHHLPKISNPGRRVNLEKEIQEIVDTLTGFPPHLTLDEQAMFAIGYYHQRQDFFTSKKEMNIE